ncbi:MAG TPA: hypothetical protein PKV72_06360, partial [Candidatus Peribacteria bacterium]|nr:hypothetical protein [Candidatus Peribacteria bacterium]
DYADDLYLASSPSAVDQWLAGVQRALSKATCVALLWQTLEHRMEDLLADTAIGADAMLAAATELNGMLTELESLRAGVPAPRTKTTVPQIIETVHAIIRAKKNYEAAAVVMTTLADVRRNTKQLYYPPEKANAI